ncbi:MAG TPA: M20 aminoacylase family protein [Micavibrio sp.]
MPILNRAADLKDEATVWRRALHQHPQTKYEEEFASALVAQKLSEWGIPFKRGLGKTGIVATIKGQKTDSGKTIGLRADMDALDILEKSGQPHASLTPGKMHACGHDGHTATLLAAAKYLNETKNFNGEVHLVFQPAEEGGNGANAMIDDGLFKDFKIDYMFAVHNWPGQPMGKIGTRPGPLMASVDEFHVTVKGTGGHAAMPHATIDPVAITAQIVTALQTVVARNVDPIDTVVVSITNFHAGSGAFNIIPDEAKLIGTVRAFNNDTREKVIARMKSIIEGIAVSMGATVEMNFMFHNYATINDPAATDMAARAAALVVGAQNVDTNTPPSMGGEDFSAYLRQKPGAFIFIGQGVPEKDSPHNKGLHHPGYDFNDEIIPIGISYFATLVEQTLPLEK